MSTIDTMTLSQIKTILKNAVDKFPQQYGAEIQKELDKSAKRYAGIIALRVAEKIDAEQFQAMMEVEKNANVITLYAIKGIGKLITQDAVNQALGIALKTLIKLI